MNEDLLVEKMGYRFKDDALLAQALSHSSFVNENGLTKFDSNERLEFLGDAMLEGFISLYLYNKLPYMEEGDLTKLRSYIVCEKTLFKCAVDLSLGGCLYLGKGEEQSGGRGKPSILADAVEALIGAIFLDGGKRAAERFVMRALAAAIEEAVSGFNNADNKSRLQELLQARGRAAVSYRVDRETGPDHDKTFFVSAVSGNKVIGKGEGRSKKLAEQSAAGNALERIN